MKWLIDKCRESETFTWGVVVIGIALMVLIALVQESKGRK